MICDSRARRASSDAGQRGASRGRSVAPGAAVPALIATLLTALLTASLAVSLAVVLLRATDVAGQVVPVWPPRLELSGPAAADPALRAHLASDRAWLAAQPAGLLVMPETDAPDEAVTTWLRQAERVQAQLPVAMSGEREPEQEVVAGRRDLLSLLRDRWFERGHLAARIVLVAGDGPDTPPLVRIEPGPAHTLAALTVEGDAFAGRQGLLDLWLPRVGDTFLPRAYLAAAADVVASCAERGHPFPLWLTVSLDIDASAAEVRIAAVLVPGPLMVVGPQGSTLPGGRGEDFLIRAAGVRSGSVFRESDLRRGRERLLMRDLYQAVDAPLVHLTASSDTVGLIWRAEPLPRPNRLAVVLGLSRREEGGTRLSGQVDLNLPNLAGTGRQLAAGWRDDGQTRSRFGFRYLEPLVLGTPLDGDLALDSEVQQDAYTRFTLNNRWRLPVVSYWGLEMGVGWDRTTYPDGGIESTRRLRWRAGVLRSRGDPARSGWSGAFAVESVQRSVQPRPAPTDGPPGDATGSQLGSQDGQRLLEVDLAGELWLRAETSLAGRAALRRIQADVLPVPLPEMYRFGGANTLRGYREDEFFGESAAYGGVELRLGRARRSRVYTFVDLGYFEFTVREAAAAGGGLGQRNGTRLGYGLGLYTPAAAGQINLAVGFPGDVDFETAMLHVSLLGSF
jgi:translocation and assembly module TamA